MILRKAVTPGAQASVTAFCRAGSSRLPETCEVTVIDLRTGAYIFASVLVFGTLFRLAQYHLMASPTPAWQHLGMAMSIQY